jgi:endogenous inhibitor of DNA gyrase (YacG/DUF329 family)
MALVRCPTCNKVFETGDSQAMPFCSERCRLIDLGHWLNEEQGVPIEQKDEDADESGDA